MLRHNSDRTGSALDPEPLSQRPIKEANEMIEMLQADIEKFEADAARVAKELAQHDEDISTWEGDFKAATEV